MEQIRISSFNEEHANDRIKSKILDLIISICRSPAIHSNYGVAQLFFVQAMYLVQHTSSEHNWCNIFI